MTEEQWLDTIGPYPMIRWLIETTNKCEDKQLHQTVQNVTKSRRYRLFAWACYIHMSCYPGSGKEDIFPRVRESTPPHHNSSAVDDARYWSAEVTHPEQLYRSEAIRDIFGNPFKPSPPFVERVECPDCMGYKITSAINIHGSCHKCSASGKVLSLGPCRQYQSDLVGQLANAVYQQRNMLPGGNLDPQRMSILADALEEAGCQDEQVLRHLRGWQQVVVQKTIQDKGIIYELQWQKKPHLCVMGCWAIELILGL